MTAPDTTPHDLNLDEIERIARAATPGPWEEAERDHIFGPDGVTHIAIIIRQDAGDTAHIARMDPPTTLALVARVREAEATKKEGHDIVARIWKQLGSPSYKALAGRSIYDLIDERDARIRDLEAKNAELVAALKPFAKYTEHPDRNDWRFCCPGAFPIDCYRARDLTGASHTTREGADGNGEAAP